MSFLDYLRIGTAYLTGGDRAAAKEVFAGRGESPLYNVVKSGDIAVQNVMRVTGETQTAQDIAKVGAEVYVETKALAEKGWQKGKEIVAEAGSFLERNILWIAAGSVAVALIVFRK